MTRLRGRGRRPRRGLTMIEVVVAVALLGIGIAACVACIGSATRASSRAEEYTAVQLLAREKLAEIELEGAALGEAHGDFGPERPGYGWQTVTTATDIRGLVQVRLILLWGNPDQPRTEEFTTFVRAGSPSRLSQAGSQCDGCHGGAAGAGELKLELTRRRGSALLAMRR